MTIEFSDPATLPSHPGYAQLAITRRPRTIYVAGQVAFDADRNVIGVGDYAAQSRQALRNVRLALEAAGAGLADLVQLTIYVVALSDDNFPAIYAGLGVGEGAGESQGLGKVPNAIVGVTSLAQSGLLVEISAIAATD